MIESATVIASWAKRCSALSVVSILAVLGMHCSSSDSATGPASTDTITVLEPKAGAKYHLADTVLIIVQTDTTVFHRKALYLFYSADSGKCWTSSDSICIGKGSAFLQTVINLRNDKGALRKDTVKWVPNDPFATDTVAVPVGQSVQTMIKVVDYPTGSAPLITRLSGFFSISN